MPRPLLLRRARTTGERQETRWNIGLVLAVDGHLVGSFRIAANPCYRHDRRIFHDGSAQRENFAGDNAVRAIAERYMDGPVLHRYRTDGIVDDLVRWREPGARIVRR